MDIKALKKELKFRASRSSGSGGQHVNKVASRIELIFDVQNSNYLDDSQKERILRKLKTRINKEGELLISAQSSRSQVLNRRAAVKKFEQLIAEALVKEKDRKGPPKLTGDREIRLKQKRLRSETKKMRQKVILRKENDLSSFYDR